MIQVNEKGLVTMIKAFREYRKLLEPIAKEQPGFQGLIDYVIGIEIDLAKLNMFINRKYDGLTPEDYQRELEILISLKRIV